MKAGSQTHLRMPINSWVPDFKKSFRREAVAETDFEREAAAVEIG